MLDKETIKEIALANGFKLKEQANGEMDLNPYVYEFANAIAEHCWSAFKSGVMPHKIHPTKASLNNGWISVDDELPEKHKEVLIYIDGNIIIAKMFIDYIQTVFWFECENENQYFNVKYWQPLPQPPKE